MSTAAGLRGPTTRSRAASSRAASEVSSVADNDHHDLRSSRAGSPKTKRSGVSTRDSKNYGSTATSAAAQRKAAARLGRTAGGIEHALNQAQGHNLDDVQEEDSTLPQTANDAIAAAEQARLEQRRLAHEQQRAANERERLAYEQRQHDDWFQAMRDENGNQPLEGSSMLQKQITLSDSNTSIERNRPVFYFEPKYFVTLAIFLVLALLFADIYRGPLLGPRFDLLKSRQVVGNQTVITPCDSSAVDRRLNNLELQYRELASKPNDETKPRQINYFSFVRGLSVDPYLTSPTGMQFQRRWQRHFRSIFGTTLTKNEAATVFGPWDEEDGPSWCAATGEAKLQLATLLATPVTPTELVVEYSPRAKDLNENNVAAPKEIELWMEVLDDDLRESIGKDFVEMYGDFLQNPMTRANRALPDNYVPIGRWTYNFHAQDHIQTLTVPIGLRGAQTNKLVVRVNSNWAGAPYACLYRLRLHGIPSLLDAGH